MSAQLMVDSLQPITREAIVWLRDHGRAPTAWARYLGGITAAEVALLAEFRITLIAIARRSGLVSYGRETGKACGIVIVQRYQTLEKLCAECDCQLSRYLFLDVEQAPDLNALFWCGWAGQVAAVACPAAYMPNRNNWPNSWASLEVANQTQACAGAWVALYPRGETPERLLDPTEWQKRPLGPSAESGIPCLAWQAIGNAKDAPIWLDYSETNPDFDWLANP